VVFIALGAKPVLHNEFEHRFALLAVEASVSDDLVDMVDAIARVRLDLFVRQSLLSQTDSSLRNFNRFFPSKSNQIDEIVDVFWSVAQRKSLLTSSRNDLGANILQLDNLPL